MDLKIGILDLTPGWKIIFDQLGLYYQAIEDHTALKAECFSTIVVNSEIDKEIIFKYLDNGGAVLFTSRAYAEIFKKQINFKSKKLIASSQDSDFADIGIIDICGELGLVDDNEMTLQDKGLRIFSGNYGKGIFYISPLEVDFEIRNLSSTRRKFPAEQKELPSEIVAKGSKAKIRRLIHKLLIKLHEHRQLPFLHKSFIPEEKGVFIFRVDTDYCSIQDAENLLSICRKHKIRATWFVDTQNEKRLADFYAKLNDQEIGLHCYRHLVFDNYDDNFENIKKGLENLKKCGLEVYGFAAPFGSWNHVLSDVLEQFEFYYSSEFVPSYDDLPFNIYYDDHFSTVLQIPIHPVSAGRLRRSHFSQSEMVDYYKTIIDRKSALHEPITIYHHPHHQLLDVFDQVFTYVNKKNIKNYTMYEYARWWQNRNSIDLRIAYSASELQFNTENVRMDLHYKNGFCNFQSQKIVDIPSLNPQKAITLRQASNEKQSRKFHWRDLLHNYESWKGRKNR